METLISLGAAIVFLPCAIGLSVQMPSRTSTLNHRGISSARKNLQLAVFKNPFSNGSQEREGEDIKVDFGSSVLDSLGLESNTEPKKFAVDSERALDIATATLPFVLRLGSGAIADGYNVSVIPRDDSKYTLLKFGKQAQLKETSYPTSGSKLSRGPIILYEFEGCPFCRKVREALCILSLEVEFRPCPKGEGTVYRNEVKDKYGPQATFPFMIDTNTGTEMFESDDIIEYLFNTYGTKGVPGSIKRGIKPSIGLSLLPRYNKGSFSKPADPPSQPLILWGTEGSPFVKIVREELCELQLVHRLIPCPRGSPNRQRMFEKKGLFQMPFLEDPNNGVELFESSAIMEYLQKVYSVDPPVVEYI